MPELEVHSAADVALSNHAATPSGTVNIHQNWIGAEDRMSGNPGLPALFAYDSVNVIPGLDLEHRAG